MNNDDIMGEGQIEAIERWLESIKQSLRDENISWGELAELDGIHRQVKTFMEEDDE